MKPAVPETTRFLAAMLRDEIVPQLSGAHAGNVGMAAAMLDMVAEHWDGTAARLHSENKALHALVSRCAAHLGEAAPAANAGDDLRISALTTQNEALRTQLIAHHVALENEGSNAAATLEDEIWAFLRDSVEQQRIGSANF